MSSSEHRKVHKNKYSDFSKKKLDPIEETILRQQNEHQIHNTNKQPPSRGTTVPTREASNNAKTAELSSASVKKADRLIDVKRVNPSDPMSFGFVKIGKILGPHGVKGELKVQFETDFIDMRVQARSVVYIKRPNRKAPRPIRIVSSRPQNRDVYLIQFEQINSRLAAAALKAYDVFVEETDRPVLSTDEYLVKDLVSLPCYAYRGETELMLIGTIIGVVLPDSLCSPEAAKLMHAMLEIRKYGSTSSNFLVPLVPEIVTSIDLEKRVVVISPPEGLMDLTYEDIKRKRVVIRGYLPSTIEWLSKQNRKFLEQDSVLLYPEGGIVIPLDMENENVKTMIQL